MSVDDVGELGAFLDAARPLHAGSRHVTPGLVALAQQEHLAGSISLRVHFLFAGSASGRLRSAMVRSADDAERGISHSTIASSIATNCLRGPVSRARVRGDASCIELTRSR